MTYTLYDKARISLKRVYGATVDFTRKVGVPQGSTLAMDGLTKGIQGVVLWCIMVANNIAGWSGKEAIGVLCDKKYH